MTDLLYFGHKSENGSKELEDEFITAINAKFSDVKLKNAYDEHKGYRQKVEMPEEMEDDYIAWLLAKGWTGCSMQVQLTLYAEKLECKRYLELAKKQYPDCFK